MKKMRMKMLWPFAVIFSSLVCVEAQQRGLFPAILNLASNAEITTNATCGDPLPEMFCKLVEHVPGRRIRNPQCRICDANSQNPKEQHPITSAIDGTNQWWQSPSIKNGRQFHWVTITLDLRQVGLAVEHAAIDGTNQWWQSPSIKNGRQFHWVTITLDLRQIHTSLINGRPSADDLTPELLEFTSARFIRLRLQRIRTLNADLMTLSYRDPKDVDPIVTRRYYYSIKDISVGGMCICYGHAQSCPWDPVTKKLQCVCEHNTCGESCNECCPGYHQEPWQPGTLSDGNTCEKCNCHNKAEDCYYNQTVADLRLSVNTLGQFVGGGVCVNCSQNTAGVNCQTCADGYYRPHQVEHRDGVLLRPLQSSSIFTSPVSDDNLIVSNLSASAGVRSEWSWAAPESFLNNKLTSYGSFLNYSVAYDTSEENVDRTLQAHFSVIIEGNGRMLREARSARLLLNAHTEQHVSLLMLPHTLRDARSRSHVQRDELMTVLADVAALRVRVQLEDSAEGTLRLSSVSLGVGDTNSGLSKVPLDVEQCECPWGYSGTSCEYCVPGFYRVGGILFGGNCLQCECNDHAAECDINGECLYCVPGFYRVGGILFGGNCLQCECNDHAAECDINGDFSPTCVLQRAGEFRCDQCQLGYAGAKCERCADGYYGDPAEPGRRCLACECNGNVDPAEAGHCDGRSGECLKCLGHTAGRHCERCADGFYGDAVTLKNCQACGCHGDGSLSTVCHVITGQCECKAHVIGQTCGRCQAGYYGISSGDGCRLCECNQSGALSASCDEEGRCQCITGVTGEKCDRCERGYYSFTESGCTPCDCAHTHGNCNADTGECICPPHTLGLKCEECEEGHWGHDGVSGCTVCNCSAEGSSSSQCELQSGQCRCRPHFSGLKCDRCALGYKNFPECTACNCNPSGTREEFCDPALGVCGCEDHGRCSCKENVGGGGCDECKSGTLGLTAQNPSGCSPCFCFGVSSYCEELGGLIRVPITLGSAPALLRVVSQSDLQGTLEGVSYSDQEMLLDASHLHSLSVLTGPYYWRLPQKYHGNKVQTPQKYHGNKVQTPQKYHSKPCRNTTKYPGDYGKVQDSVRDCSLCTCPLQGQSFSSTCVLEGAGDFRCDRCEEGYEGRYCERCSVGYYGNPSEPGGRCQVCQCRGAWSVHTICDGRTGSCECKPGARGHLCDQCEERHVLVSEQCVSCDDECTGALLDDLDALDGSIGSLNLSGVILAPYSQLMTLENQTREVKSLMSWEQSSDYQLTAGEEHVSNLTNHITDLQQQVRLMSVITEYHDIQTNLQTLTISRNNVSSLKQEVETQVQEAQDLLSDALNIAEDMRNGTATLDETRNDLEGWSPSLRKHVDALVMDMTKRDALQLVYRTSESEHSLTEQGKTALQKSSEILDTSGSLKNHTEGLVFSVREVTSRLSLVRASVQNVTQLLPEALNILRNLPNGSRAEVLEAKQQQEAANASLQEALERLEDYRVKLQESSSAVGSANNSIRSTNQLVRDSEETASAARSRLSEAHLKTERLFDRLKPLQTLGENLSRNLSQIKELIHQARKQAASIKVAVSADKDCVRAYRPEVSSSNFNTLTLTMKTSEPDSLLFYMGSSSASEDFMALEMHHGKVSFLWDTGSGLTRLEYPSVQINNDKWHRINATRFGRHGTLTVQQTDSEPLPAVKTTASGSSTVMDVNKSTWVFVGGLGAQVKKPPAVKMTHFRGCIGEASLNENNIGLWNYAERQGECGGCFMSPRTEDTSFHFDGSGFSVLEKSLRSMSTSVVMFFKTLSPNGLLLYLASNGTRDFLSIELVEGKVHLTFELGSGALTLTSNRTYNTGTWYRIALQRNKRRGHLSVMAADKPSEREVMEAESPGSSSDLNRSDLDPIYIGGLPASRPIRRQVVARSFVGCMKNVEIARTNFDLLRESYGVKKGCVLKPIRSVSVFGGGFLQMPAILLAPHTEIMSSFSSRRERGVILAGFSSSTGRSRRHTQQPFLVVMLLSGSLEVHVGGAEGGAMHRAVVKSQNGSFSDGQEHSLILQRNKRSIAVFVDEQNQATVKLGSSADKALALERLFIGGVPPGETGSSDSFYGCIRNTAVDGMLLDLSAALRYEDVDMDSCLLEERPKRVVLPDELEAEPTSDPATRPLSPPVELSALTPGSSSCAAADLTETLPESLQFGLSRHSHVIMGFKNKTVRTSFAVKLSVRTFARSGVLFYMANANQQDYAVLQVQGGRVLLSCDLGKGPAHASLATPINNGLWHTVKAEFSKKMVMVSVDGTESDRKHTKGHTLDVEGKLYLGGLPATYTARRIGNVTHSLAACLRDVMFSGVQMKLSAALSSHAAGSCFRRAQSGSFFSGSGYAAFMKEGYNVGSDVSVSLDFRSTAPDGVLLGISSTKVDAIGLELVNGQVVFNVNNGAGWITASSRSAVSMCDGRWRTLVAKKQKHSLSLTVDGVTVTAENPYSSSTSAETKNPIYVGGYPADVKQNCLSSREPFRGCMRNLRVFKGHVTDELDFSAAFAHPHVFPHSCPDNAA
ncbi:laminin subunit alpha-1-like [Sinocyclocheilus anshuiensis]|nr:PREDICTED: laminin subunit alpha-1-like [Sinocyclocheilus anshuiensis]